MTIWLKRIAILVAFGALSACSSGSSNGTGSTTTTAKAATTTGTVAAGAWRPGPQGTFRSKAWKISYAKSSTGWWCYDAEGAAQPITGTGATSSAAAGPQRNGRVSRCLAPASAPASVPFTAFLDGADANQWVVVGAAAGRVKHVNIVFADGTTSPLNVDPHSRLVIWKGPTSVRPRGIRADNTTCTLDPKQTASHGSRCDGTSA